MNYLKIKNYLNHSKNGYVKIDNLKHYLKVSSIISFILKNETNVHFMTNFILSIIPKILINFGHFTVDSAIIISFLNEIGHRLIPNVGTSHPFHLSNHLVQLNLLRYHHLTSILVP